MFLQEDISAGESKKELANSQNIPSTQTIAAVDSNKTGTYFEHDAIIEINLSREFWILIIIIIIIHYFFFFFLTEQTVAESRPKKYSMEFLLKLRDLPQCKKPVKIAPNLENQLYADHTDGGYPVSRMILHGDWNWQ